MVYRVLLLFAIFFLSGQAINSESFSGASINITPPFYNQDSQWVDSLMQNLSLKDKISQLFIIAVYSDKTEKYNQQIIKLLNNYKVGGILFMEGSPVNQVKLTNRLQKTATIPLMIGMDAEYGLAMRLDSTIAYPCAMALGAIKNDQLIYNFGRQMADQLHQLGVNISFSPVVDVNSNSENPVINQRSFSEDKRLVSRKGLAYAVGLQDDFILSVAKHFPGHGDTNKDSHYDLPLVKHGKVRLNQEELVPFKNMIQNGVGGIMVAHLAVPAYEKEPNRPASLSANVIDSLLLGTLNFKGLVFTDALNMAGVTKYFKPGEIEVQALLAGNDVLLFSQNVEQAIHAVLEAVENGRISEDAINKKCKKVLQTKRWLGLRYPFQAINPENLNLFKPEYKKLKANMVEQSLTLIQNKNNALPIKNLADKHILAIGVGSGNATTFFQMLNRYKQVDTICFDADKNNFQLADTLLKYHEIIVCYTGIKNVSADNFNIRQNELDLLKQILSTQKTVHLCFMGAPYGLALVPHLSAFSSILIAYADDSLWQSKAAQAIFGGIAIDGRLPVTINSSYPAGTGLTIANPIRLGYASPAAFGLLDNAFYKVDSIAQAAIEMHATPGCQILYVKNNKVLYHKCFGYYTYKKLVPVSENNIYDLASITKMAATTLSLMKLYEAHQVNLTTKLFRYLPAFKTKDKRNIRFNEVLAHQSGMKPWIPFYRSTLLKEGGVSQRIYRTEKTDSFNIQVSDQLFIRSDYRDSIYKAIIDTPTYHTKKYRYSDLGFYYLPKLIQQQMGKTIDRFVQDNFYKPLGMDYTLYNPLKKFNKSQVVPTQDDRIFRQQIVQGFVHDPGAAMLGGVSGHAGLFSNANDLAKLGQMLLNQGSYGGQHYLQPKTLTVFNKAYFKRKHNRRALGFDKPALQKGDPGPTCQSASQISFGHSGFTGTYFWIDPKYQSVYIFLSNRTFPDQNNPKLLKNDIRTKIQQEFYNVFEH